ncbi:DUF6461 domain-containing protein [Streptomyces sp. NPDC012421]|uniref:DUF6461 domain-containing protein n=1 Tax=Streptomyces sp. NPDC012421 TaxID=3364832 RepID=UPI0036ED855C
MAGASTVPDADGDWTLVLDFDGGAGTARFLPASSLNGRAVSHTSTARRARPGHTA